MRSNKESKFGGEGKVVVLPDVQNTLNQRGWVVVFPVVILNTAFQSFYFQSFLT